MNFNVFARYNQTYNRIESQTKPQYMAYMRRRVALYVYTIFTTDLEFSSTYLTALLDSKTKRFGETPTG